MKKTISAIFLSTLLPAALSADTNGLTSEILNRAKSPKANSAALQDSSTDAHGMLSAAAANQARSLTDTRSALVDSQFSSVENRIANEPSGVEASPPSSGSKAETQKVNEPSSLKSSLRSESNAETQKSDAPSSLASSLTSGSKAETQMTVAPSSLASSLTSASNAETQIKNEPSSLKSSLSSEFNAEIQMNNEPSSLKSFLPPSSDAFRQGP